MYRLLTGWRNFFTALKPVVFFFRCISTWLNPFLLASLGLVASLLIVAQLPLPPPPFFSFHISCFVRKDTKPVVKENLAQMCPQYRWKCIILFVKWNQFPTVSALWVRAIRECIWDQSYQPSGWVTNRHKLLRLLRWSV